MMNDDDDDDDDIDGDNNDNDDDDVDANLGSSCRLHAGVFGALLLAECWGCKQIQIQIQKQIQMM